MQDLFLSLNRAWSPIDGIFNSLFTLVSAFFKSGGYLDQLINTIVDSPYLLISVSLLLCGFILGILKRIISI